jgi:hypothetical protein
MGSMKLRLAATNSTAGLDTRHIQLLDTSSSWTNSSAGLAPKVKELVTSCLHNFFLDVSPVSTNRTAGLDT